MAHEVARHAAEIAQERAERDARLRDPMGWLSLVGLHWLVPGRQRFGAHPSNEIVLRSAGGAMPPVAGVFDVVDGAVHVHPTADSRLSVAGQPVPDGLALVDDVAGEPTLLELASLRMYLIRRGHDRLALRVKDIEAPAITAFGGMPWYSVDPSWRVTARLIPAAAGATIPVPDIVGNVVDEPTPGDLEFERDGATHRLRALEGQRGNVTLVFGDATNGEETYGAGRFLDSGPVQADNSVELDFNRAYNPPCVFSPYATCPLPPDGNRLPIRVTAGELLWRPAET